MEFFCSAAFTTYIVSFSEEVKRAAYAGRADWLVVISLFNNDCDFQPRLPSSSLASSSDIITRRLKFCITVIGTGLLGWLLNIVLVLCSGPLCVRPVSVVHAHP